MDTSYCASPSRTTQDIVSEEVKDTGDMHVCQMYFSVWKIWPCSGHSFYISYSYRSCDVLSAVSVIKESHGNPVKSGFRFVANYKIFGESHMKFHLKPVFALLVFVTLLVSSLQALGEEEVFVELKTDHFKLAKTDISAMAVGEAKTIETDSGKVIDILRTADGAEIYVDGELLEMNLDEGIHGVHVIKKHLEVTCEGEDECGHHVVIKTDLDEIHEAHADGDKHKLIIIHEEVDTED
jgi:hypothetical protein